LDSMHIPIRPKRGITHSSWKRFILQKTCENIKFGIQHLKALMDQYARSATLFKVCFTLVPVQ